MFEVSQRGETTTVKTDTGVYKIKFSPRWKRYQVFKAPSKAILRESLYGFQGALDLVSEMSKKP